MKESVVVEGVSTEMVENTLAKFRMWDSVVELNLLETGSEEKRRMVYALLRDPTVYAYAFFKDPRNLSKPFKMYSYQDLIINDTGDRLIFVAANQIGKSIALCIDALHHALMNPGKTYLMTSKTLPQSKDLLRQIKFFLNHSSLEYKFDIGDSETKTEIYFKHFEEYEVYDKELDKNFMEVRELPQSRIICVPATEAALGYPVDGLFIDELAFYENGDYFYKQIAQPRTYHTKGFIKVFGNPNGQQGIFWELWNNKRFNKYRFNFMDCPKNTQEEFEKNSMDLTREQLDSTLLAEFTSPEGGFLTLEERRNMQEERPSVLPAVIATPIYIFFDWGKSWDRTVRIIGIPVKNSESDWAAKVYVYEMLEYPQGTPYTQIVDEDLKDLITLVGFEKVAMVGWDNTGVGHGIEDFVKRVQHLGIQAMPVSFDGENKSRIYTLLKLLAEQRRIKIPYVRECDKQLSTLRFKRSERGYLMVHHAKEKDRDDFPDCLAGLSSLMIQPENPPVSATIVGLEEDEDQGKEEEYGSEGLGFV